MFPNPIYTTIVKTSNKSNIRSSDGASHYSEKSFSQLRNVGYEQQVEAIRQANQPILDGFEIWLRQSGLSEQTIKAHVDNMRFFSRYLLLYSYSLRRLDQTTEGAVYDFLEDWFPRKALWASISSMKVYLASFKKFYQWMGASGLVSAETAEDVLSTLKDNRNLFLRKVAE